MNYFINIDNEDEMENIPASESNTETNEMPQESEMSDEEASQFAVDFLSSKGINLDELKDEEYEDEEEEEYEDETLDEDVYDSNPAVAKLQKEFNELKRNDQINQTFNITNATVINKAREVVEDSDIDKFKEDFYTHAEKQYGKDFAFTEHFHANIKTHLNSFIEISKLKGELARYKAAEANNPMVGRMNKLNDENAFLDDMLKRYKSK